MCTPLKHFKHFRQAGALKGLARIGLVRSSPMVLFGNVETNRKKSGCTSSTRQAVNTLLIPYSQNTLTRLSFIFSTLQKGLGTFGLNI